MTDNANGKRPNIFKKVNRVLLVPGINDDGDSSRNIICNLNIEGMKCLFIIGNYSVTITHLWNRPTALNGRRCMLYVELIDIERKIIKYNRRDGPQVEKKEVIRSS